MAKFVLANRRAGMFTPDRKKAAREQAERALGALATDARVLGTNQPANDEARRVAVLEADPGDVAARATRFGADVVVERALCRCPAAVKAPHDLRGVAAGAVPAGAGASLSAELVCGGAPLRGAAVELYLRGAGGASTVLRATSGATGRVSFEFGQAWAPAALVVEPAADAWTTVVRGPRDGERVEIPALPRAGPLGWWHRAMGITAWDPQRGAGIRVGVVDTGVGPHPRLAHVRAVGAYVDGTFDPGGGADADRHGSHVCGIVGARPQGGGEYGGAAPGAELLSLRVFPPGDAGANQGDIAAAVDHLSKLEQADLLNLSLGGDAPSEIERDALRDALERGTLCLVAAGNEGTSPPAYPARYPEAVAISALGLEGWAPPGTFSATSLPARPDRFGAEQLYLAAFSNYGKAVDAAAGGVGIVSTVPARPGGPPAPYAALDGTSMACPAACGALAAILAASPAYRAMPRNLARAQQARALLAEACKSVHLAARLEGFGVPQVA